MSGEILNLVYTVFLYNGRTTRILHAFGNIWTTLGTGVYYISLKALNSINETQQETYMLAILAIMSVLYNKILRYFLN